MEEKAFKRQLLDYQKRVKDWLKNDFKNGGYDKEQNTTIKFVVPLLNILGWDSYSKEMEFEYPIHQKERDKLTRVDIALYTKDSKKPKILVEIKRIQEELGTGRQLLRYLHAEKVKYGIYTNGREVRLIDIRTPTKYIPEGLFIIRAEDFSSYPKVLSALSKNSVERGLLHKIVKSFHTHDFWGEVQRKEKKVKKNDRKKLKYYLRLDYVNRQL